MSVRIPARDKRWRISHQGDFFGHLTSTRGMNFDRNGYAALSNKSTVISSSAFDVSGNGNIGDILSIAPDDTASLVVTNNRVFTFSEVSAVLTQETDTGGPTIFNGSDGLVFDSLRTVSGTTTVHTLSGIGGSWTQQIVNGADGVTLSASFPHPMAVFENKNQLAVANQNKVFIFDASNYNRQATMTLPADYVITTMRWRGNNLYIGTRNREGLYAKMFIWNGTGSEAQSGWTINAPWIYSMEEFLGSMWVITSQGQLKRFNGGGFSTPLSLSLPDGNFPVYYTKQSWLADDSFIGNCMNRGMASDGDVLYINLKAQANVQTSEPFGDIIPNMPSGVWCYDPEVGLYHRNNLATNKYQTIDPDSVASNIFTLPSNHEASAGDAVFMKNIGSLTGITVNFTYFAIVTGVNKLSLALTEADAKAGNAITIGGSVGSSSFYFDDREAIGSTYDTTYPGAIATIQANDSIRAFYGSQYLYGARVLDTDGSTDIYTFQSEGLGRNVGSFTTVLIPSGEITDTQQKLYVKFEGVEQATDQIVLKYRKKGRFGLPTTSRKSSSGLATWSSNQVVAVDDTEKHVRQAKVGDEIEIISGGGSGRTAHITSINEASASVREFTLDEKIEGVLSAQKSEIQIDNWIKLGTVTNANTEGFQEFPIGGNSKRIEFKVELRGKDVKIEEMSIVNTTSKKAQ